MTRSSPPPWICGFPAARSPGGQIVVQGIFDASAARIVHAITGGTGIYRGARGQFSFTEPASGVLDMTLTLLPSDRG